MVKLCKAHPLRALPVRWHGGGSRPMPGESSNHLPSSQQQVLHVPVLNSTRRIPPVGHGGHLAAALGNPRCLFPVGGPGPGPHPCHVSRPTQRLPSRHPPLPLWCMQSRERAAGKQGWSDICPVPHFLTFLRCSGLLSSLRSGAPAAYCPRRSPEQLSPRSCRDTLHPARHFLPPAPQLG